METSLTMLAINERIWDSSSVKGRGASQQDTSLPLNRTFDAESDLVNSFGRNSLDSIKSPITSKGAFDDFASSLIPSLRESVALGKARIGTNLISTRESARSLGLPPSPPPPTPLEPIFSHLSPLSAGSLSLPAAGYIDRHIVDQPPIAQRMSKGFIDKFVICQVICSCT